MSLPAMSLAVVGAKHKNADGSDRRVEIEECMPGEHVELVPEPDNEADRHAIAVYSCRDIQIGYVSADRAPRIGQLLGSTEAVAVFQRQAKFGAWIRIAFDGETPVITDAMLDDHDEGGDGKNAGGEPDFYPDEEWPDE